MHEEALISQVIFNADGKRLDESARAQMLATIGRPVSSRLQHQAPEDRELDLEAGCGGFLPASLTA